MKWLFLVAIVGCSQHPGFREYNAGKPIDALNELIYRRESVIGFTTVANFTLDLQDRSISFRGKIKYRSEKGWTVVLSGPLGMNLVVLNMDNSNYNLFLTQSGHVTSGCVTDSLKILEMGILLPSVEMLIKSLFPTIDINREEDWQVDELESNRQGSIHLYRNDGDYRQRINLEVRNHPLRIIQENHYSNGNTIFTRKFNYCRDSDNIPRTITVRTGNNGLKITYHSLQMEWATPSEPGIHQENR